MTSVMVDEDVSVFATRLRESARERSDQTFSNPQGGVWQLWVERDGWPPTTYDPTLPRPAPPCEFTLRVKPQ